MKCELCNIEVPNIQFLSGHLTNVHKDVDRKNYYDKYLKQPKDGICNICDCSTKYINIIQGYADICNKCKFDISHTKTCVICGEPFVSRDSRTKICKNPECRKIFGHDKYKNNTKTCICKMCGNTYQATGKQKKDMCKDCIRKTRNYTSITFEQIIGCKYCGEPVSTTIKHYSSKTPKQLNYVVCDSCKQLSRARISLSMKLNNPSYSKALTQEEYDKKQASIKFHQTEEYKTAKRQEIKEKCSQRMKEHNPMYNKETSKKVSKTLKARYETGEIKKVYGKEHWLYKGSRTIKGYLRLCLTDWIKSNLIRTNYTCEKCGRRGCTLHVHHKESFADLVDRGLKELNLDINAIEFRDDNYQKLEQWILDYHNTHDIGLVVCRKCHAEVDKHYYAPKKLYRKEF